jgi:hypothetical protein
MIFFRLMIMMGLIINRACPPIGLSVCPTSAFAHRRLLAGRQFHWCHESLVLRKR